MDAALRSTSDESRAGPTPLSGIAIERSLQACCAEACLVEAIAVTGSTHDDLANLARARQPSHCLLRATDYQTGGRGRRMRAWRASPGDALLFSLAVPINTVPGSLSAASLVCGVALVECLAEHGVRSQLKWPNDVRVDRRKLAGILCELVSDRERRRTLVIGVGINWHLDAEALRSIGQPAVALDQLLQESQPQPREWWIGRLAGALLKAIETFVRHGFDPFNARFNELLEARGEMVDIIDQQRTIAGRVIEVDRLGRLIVESTGERIAVNVGDVSIRQPQR